MSFIEIQCREVLSSVIFIVEGEQQALPQADAISSHLSTCAPCSAEVAHERLMHQMLQDVLKRSCDEQAPEDLQSRIAAQTALLASQMFSPTQVITEYRRTETTINGETHIEIETTHEIRRDFPLS